MEVSGQYHTLTALPPSRNPGTPWKVAATGRKAGPDNSDKRKISTPARIQTLDLPAHNLVTTPQLIIFLWCNH